MTERSMQQALKTTGYALGCRPSSKTLWRVSLAGRGWRWLRGGRSRPPQLVLLDHGAHVVLPEHLRRSYCQLWAAFVTGDEKGAEQVGRSGFRL